MAIIPPAIPFIGSRGSTPLEGAPALLGVPYDKTASFRKGTRFGPDSIREISEPGIETYSPRQDKDLEDFPLADLGNLALDPDSPPEVIADALYRETGLLLSRKALPVILGGEHSISPGAIRAAHEIHPDLVVLQFDAHADLRESYENSRFSHACAMRRVLDFLPSAQLYQIGIRSGTREEYHELRTSGRRLDATPRAIASVIENLSAGAPLWITFDLDIFDPAELPGTGTPEAGGLTWREFEDILPCFQNVKIAGLDIVELSPGLDPSGISTVLAAKLLREWLLVLSQGSVLS